MGRDEGPRPGAMCGRRWRLISILRKRAVYFTMSSMSLDKQGGYVSATLLSLIIAIVFLVGSLGFGAWAFTSRQDYKYNSDQKASAAAEAAKKATQEADAAKFAEEAKNPLKTYKGPDQFGGVTVAYPKTWSGYVIIENSGGTPVDNYYHPDVVPDTNEQANAFGLRVQVVEESYDKVLSSYGSDVKAGRLAASQFVFPQVASIVGTRFDGEVETDKQGSLVVVPMRNLTLKVWTESPVYLADFNNIILPNLVFSP
jgi:hypothetical protein